MAESATATATFLFTDIEGSTNLLRTCGRTRYSELLGTHARLLRKAFADHHGVEIDTQGDSFFFAFPSATDGVAAAVDAQRALASHEWPVDASVRVRMGIHTGEAARTDGHYVGFAVHRTARICAAAHGGQVLISAATRSVVEDDLDPGVDLRDLGEQRLKDLPRPERLFQLVVGGLAAQFPPLRTLEVAPEAHRRPIPQTWNRRVAYAGAGIAAAGVAVIVLAVVWRGGAPSAPAVVANSVAVIDPRTNKVIEDIPVGESPNAITAGAGGVWTANTADQTVSHIDARTRELVKTFGTGTTPGDVVADANSVWVLNVDDGTLIEIDPTSHQRRRAISVAIPGALGPGYVLHPFAPQGKLALGAGVVWVANQWDGRLQKVSTAVGKVVTRIHGGPIRSPALPSGGFAVGHGSVWSAEQAETNAGIGGQPNAIVRTDASTSRIVDQVPTKFLPIAIAITSGYVWVALASGRVLQIDPAHGAITNATQVGADLIGIAAGASGIWTANGSDGTVSRLDASSGSLQATIKVGQSPSDVAVAEGLVWVSVVAA